MGSLRLFGDLRARKDDVFGEISHLDKLHQAGNQLAAKVSLEMEIEGILFRETVSWRQKALSDQGGRL